MNHASLEFFLNRKIEIGLALDRARGVKIGKAQECVCVRRCNCVGRNVVVDSMRVFRCSFTQHGCLRSGERIETAVSMSTRAD